MPSAYTRLFRRIGATCLLVAVFIVIFFTSAPHDPHFQQKAVSFTEDHHNKIELHHEKILALEERISQHENEKAGQLERQHVEEWNHFFKAKPPQQNSKVDKSTKMEPAVSDEALPTNIPVKIAEENFGEEMAVGEQVYLHQDRENLRMLASRDNLSKTSAPRLEQILDLGAAYTTTKKQKRKKKKNEGGAFVDRSVTNARLKKKLKTTQRPLHTTSAYKSRQQLFNKQAKVILIYTQLHGHDEWYNLHIDDLPGFTNRSACSVWTCEITYDKSLLPIAAAVIFHDRDMPSPDELYELSRSQRPSNQRWVFFTSETPKNTEHSLLPYNNLFNWTMTYKLASDIVLPYLQYRALGKDDPRPPKKNYAQGKKKKVAWLVGNCHFGLRMEVVQVLQAFTDVYVGGACRDSFKQTMNCTRWCSESELANYKFFLALENGVCTDYITEKYWYYLEKDLVPIVLGGADYSNPLLAIPDSFINIASYDSLEELGKYINYLDSHDDKYNSYFEWKQYYKVWHPPSGDWPFESYWVCKLCEMLHDSTLPKKVYERLSDFWDEQTDCELPERKLTSQLFPKDYDWDHESEEEALRLKKAKIPVEFDEI